MAVTRENRHAVEAEDAEPSRATLVLRVEQLEKQLNELADAIVDLRSGRDEHSFTLRQLSREVGLP